MMSFMAIQCDENSVDDVFYNDDVINILLIMFSLQYSGVSKRSHCKNCWNHVKTSS